MSILKGGAVSTAYNFTYIDNERWLYFDLTNEDPVANTGQARTDKLPIQNNSIILSQPQYISMILFWDNSTYLGAWQPGTNTASWVLDNTDWPSNGVLTVPNNATHFALDIYKTDRFDAFYSDITFNQFSNATVSYQFSPAIDNIYYGTNTIDKVYAGGTLVFGTPPFGAYELIADVEVTSNTTQIDFDNLNITKDDELRLVYTSIGTSTSTSIGLFVNDNTTRSNYYYQRLIGDGSSLSATRINDNQIYITRPYGSGYADIKISNNDRYVVQSYNIEYTNTSKSDIAQWNWNLVGDFTVSSINKLSLITLDTSRFITPNSRFQLYKVNTGSA